METTTRTEIDSPEPNFADNFLQDRNIKWILASGAAILLGSSVMLVSSQWSGYSAVFKEIIVLAYTYGIFAVGRYGYKKLSLRRTGTVLAALALLLAPAACAALPWLWEQESWNVAYVALLIAAGGITTRIGSSTFRHFLREPQPTLTAAYVILSLAAAVTPVAKFLQSPPTALVFWAVFAVGAIKANRRVFWLVEEHRRPRIIGFFPMGLLGAQFLALFTYYYAEVTAVDWIGFGCVLTAVPLLAAADAVACVFQQRTGDLVRPLPAAILAPLGVGLLLCAGGVMLSATTWNILPMALVPSAALAAGLMALVARRTQQRAFVYASLVLTVVAYRYLPIYFLETVRALMQSTADAIQEPKLPWAYYGFTFLPLLAVFTAVGEWARNRGDKLFAEPFRFVAVSLGLAFLALSVTHEKALFPTAATLAGVFTLQTLLYRNRLLAVPAIIAFGIAAAGIPAFYNGVLSSYATPLPSSLWFTCEAIAALLLTTVGMLIDRKVAKFPATCIGRPLSLELQNMLQQPCREAGLAASLGLSGLWLLNYALGFMALPGLPIAGLLAATVLVQAYRHGRFELSVVAIVLANAVVGLALAEFLPRDVTFVNAQIGVLVTQWFASYALLRRADTRLGSTFGPAVRQVVVVALGLAYIGVALPAHAANLAIPGFITPLIREFAFATVLLFLWACDAARRDRHELLAYAAIAGLFLFSGSVLRIYQPGDFAWVAVLWTAIAAGLIPLEQRSRRPALVGLNEPLRNIVPSVLLLIAVGSWCSFTLPATIAGLSAPLVLQLSQVSRRHVLRGQVPAMLLNWRLLGVVAGLSFDSHVQTVLDLSLRDLSVAALPTALAAAFSLIIWTARQRHLIGRDAQKVDLDLVRSQRQSLQSALVYLIAMSCLLPALNLMQVLMASAVFAIVIALQLYEACIDEDERKVWVAEMLAAAAVAYFVAFDVIQLGRGFAMYVVLGLGLVLWLFGRLAQRRSQTRVLADPFQLTGRYLPLVAVGLGVYRHLAASPCVWTGWNSQALLLAAAFYFHQGLVVRSKNFTILAAGILNVALALLWQELNFTDPQLYLIPLGITLLGLVELLEQEIPAAYRDPLRYAGALIILVSPTVHIVDGSWFHIFTLMVAAALVLLAGIGLRVRAMLYTGTAFLLADLAAMVVRGSIDHPELLWVAGLALGAAVLALGAVCELRRERILQRVRAVSASLETWK